MLNCFTKESQYILIYNTYIFFVCSRRGRHVTSPLHVHTKKNAQEQKDGKKNCKNSSIKKKKRLCDIPVVSKTRCSFGHTSYSAKHILVKVGPGKASSREHRARWRHDKKNTETAKYPHIPHIPLQTDTHNYSRAPRVSAAQYRPANKKMPHTDNSIPIFMAGFELSYSRE